MEQTLDAAIAELRAYCNAEIARINGGDGTATFQFHAINAWLKRCDKVFRAYDLQHPTK